MGVVISAAAEVVIEDNIVSEGYVDGLRIEPGCSVDYNLVWGRSRTKVDLRGGAAVGTNIEAHPRMNDPEHGDYTLREGFSPCIDAGNPLTGYDDPDGTRNDIGMYGGAAGSW